MSVLSPSSQIGKKVLLSFIEDVANNKKDALRNGYVYLANQLSTISLKDTASEGSAKELVENFQPDNATYNSPYNSILGYDGFSKDELIQVRDALIAPFVSDVYAGGSDNEDLNSLIGQIIEKDPRIVQKVTLLIKEIETAINLHKIED